ncbi:MAG: hypothetical protein HYT65_03145 [Candidatus Yanofskybacteria bacterium]|nr:hypothetical protein [Candidatus Yanofskybacteria bacterium]
MATITAIQRKLDKLNADKSEVLKQKLEAIQRILVKCVKCHKKSRLGAWSFVQGRWYVEPYSCTGGDYWNFNKTETCHITCPKCGDENYIYNHPQKNKIVELVDGHHFSTEKIFKGVTEKFRR